MTEDQILEEYKNYIRRSACDIMMDMSLEPLDLEDLQELYSEMATDMSVVASANNLAVLLGNIQDGALEVSGFNRDSIPTLVKDVTEIIASKINK